MKPSIQKLQKYFKLEASSGYPNRAVIGGLDRMLDMWVAEARADGIPEDLIQLVVARIQDYGRLPQKGRSELLQGLWRRLQRGDAGPAEEGELASAAPEVETAQPETALASGEAIGAASTAEPTVAPEQTLAEPAPVKPAPPETGTGAAAPVLPAAPPPPESAPAPAITAAAIPEPANLPPPAEPRALRAPVTVIDGIGEHLAAVLERIGLRTIQDMLYYFPRRYDDYTRMSPINRLKYGEVVTVVGTVMSFHTRKSQDNRLTILEAVISDGTGSLRATWFNQKYQLKKLRQGIHITLAGKVKQYLGRPVMDNPIWEPVEEETLVAGRIHPIYPLTEGITNKRLSQKIHAVVNYWALRVPDPLPAEMRRQVGLIGLQTALLQIHSPDGWDELKAAQERLAFDEIFLLQLGVLGQKRQWQDRTARAFDIPAEWLELQTASLPFQPTGAQQRVIADICTDLQSGRPMNRLIQGDVGSGKTAVAAIAIAMVTREGAQAALMAPTAILAEQHYKSMLRLLAGAPPEPEYTPPPVEAEPKVETELELELEVEAEAEPGVEIPLPDELPTETEVDAAEAVQTEPEAEVTAGSPPDSFGDEAQALPEPTAEPLLQESEIRLMVGATTEAEKRAIRQGLADGSIKLIIGTHALIEDPVVFQDLELVIVDEQHRFGVEQRAALRSKGDSPHLLVMTATPIPRSLALTIYGDLDLSIIDEMPPGRRPVGTYVLLPRERERAYTLIRGQVELGRQAFIIYPLIETGADADAKAAVDEHARLQREVFPRMSVGLLHGRMPADEKEAVMADFRGGRYQVLVSTTVIEVGVDVPNATVMLIEGANRFGLAQLHQLRGRVGRNAEKSYCLLIPESPDQVENERLEVMASTTDGFVLAEKDLEQRGPGQFLGTRQAGFAEMRFSGFTDVRLIEKARRQAQALFEKDPDLSRPEHRLLALALQQFWSGGVGDIS